MKSRQLGRWTLLKPLARGGMGEVYLGTAGGIEGAERPCVVKIIRREHRKDTSFLARFFDEARIQAQLQHPGVAQVLEASTDSSGKPYVVLEYIEGRNLSEIRQRAAQLKIPMSWADAVAVAVTLAEALVHVHERTDATGRALSIVHRDISPQNVMVGYAGDVKLIDFGTARGENRRCQTVSGVVFAKPGYVAPEVANQNQPGPQADLYAVGIILWELAMGRRFLTGDPSEHLAKVGAGTLKPSPLSSANNVPLELDTIVARLTAPELADRYQTARDALVDLVRVLSRAPSLADGERSVRGRIAHLMSRLYPAEPMRSRSEFARLVGEHRRQEQPNPFLSESPEPGESRQLLPGTRYQLLREIAKSSMSVVYEAEHIDLERRVALKVLPKERCENPHFEARFRREAKAIAQVRSESMVTLHDFGVSQDGRPYFAMELLSGKTLSERSEEQTWRCKDALQVGVAICRALEAAHERGVIHRDIKPANVFVTDDGAIKLLDFGVAQAGEEELEDENSNALHVTGTLEYMAPEQIGKDEVSVRADIYALATVLYEMVTGRLPYVAETTVQLLDVKRTTLPMPPRQAWPQARLPASLDSVLLKALDPSPAARHPSAKRFGEALQGVIEQLDGKRRPLLRSAAIAAIAAAGVAMVFHVGPMELGQRLLAMAAERSAVRAQNVTGLDGTTSSDDAGERASSTLLTSAAPADILDVDSLPIAEDFPESDPSAELTARAGAEAPDGAAGVEERGEVEPILEAHAGETVSDETTAEKDDPANGGPVDEAPGDLTAEEVKQLERAEVLLEAGGNGHLRALDLFRTLAKAHEHDPRVLEGWSKAAARSKWWGESLRVALRWASFDDSPRAQLHLARTQRLIGQRYGAIQTLERLLERSPENEKALSMLARYRGR